MARPAQNETEETRTVSSDTNSGVPDTLGEATELDAIAERIGA